jgi:hypothetical protein
MPEINSIVHITLDSLLIDVKILEHKRSYGRDRWLVTPVAGTGEKWIEKIS